MTGSINPATVDRRAGNFRSTRSQCIGLVRSEKATADALRVAAMIRTSAGTIVTNDAPAPALMTGMGAARMSVLTTGTISITNTIAGLVRRIRTRWFIVDGFVEICGLYPGELPFLDFAWRWQLRSDHFVAVEQTQRIKGQFQLECASRVSLHQWRRVDLAFLDLLDAWHPP